MADRHLSLVPPGFPPPTTPDPGSGWAELHTHSAFSFLRGATTPQDLAAEAARLGIHTLALTDSDSLTGARRLAAAATEHGVATIYGAELTLHVRGLGRPIILARSIAGFMALSETLSAAQLAGAKGAPVYDLDRLAADAGGHWAVLTGCPGSTEAPGFDDVNRLASRITRLQEIFGDTVHAELVDHQLPLDSTRNDALVVAAHRTGAPVVASGAVHYASPGSARLAQAMTALRRREDLTAAVGHLHPAPTAHLRTGDEMARRLVRYPGVIDTTLVLAAQCTIDLDDLRPQLPSFLVPAGHSDDSYLRRLAEDGTRARYGPRSTPAADKAWQLLDHELSVIAQLGLAGYFLIVWDLVAFARRADIWCQGRGSAANSVVCFALGITNVDPVKRKLLFARFLNPDRASTPDIDVDFEHSRREEVLTYAWQRYGRRHAAMVANIITYRPRSAVRDAARSLGYPAGAIDEMTRHLGHEPPTAESPVPADVRELAAQLHGLPRHLGIHSGGMVLTREPIGAIMPTEWATKEGRSVLQGDKEDCEAAGLVKIDLLSLGILTALHDACRLIAQHGGPTYDLASIPQDDPAVYAMIEAGQTIGCFQIESRAQVSTLPRLKPRTFDDLVVAVSLIRPGPIQGGSVNPYLRRRAGREAITYPHPLAEAALQRSLGIPLWQEQVMSLAMDCAGVSAGQADRLRKDLSAKDGDERAIQWRERLLSGMAARSIPEAAAQEIYTMIAGFSGYGFPESHAASMAHLVYASAWLRHHHPAAFTCSLLRAQPMGFYSPATLIGDVQRRGIPVLGVDVQRSSAKATLTPSPNEPGKLSIRLGLDAVRGLGAEDAERIARLQPYADIEDFARRAGLSVRALETLATAGAFNGFGIDRRAALWQAGALATLDEDIIPGADLTPPAPPLTPMTAVELTIADLWATGTSPTHPVHHLRSHLDAYGAVTAAGIQHLPDQQPVTIGALVTHRQRPPTAKGTAFLAIEDETGLANVILAPPVWDRHARIVLDHAGLLITGHIERADGAVNIIAHRLQPLTLATPQRRDRRHP